MSTLRESSLERRMTTNAVHKSTTLQSAETAANNVAKDVSNLIMALNSNGATVTTYQETKDNDIELTGQVRYVGSANSSGYSLGNNGGFEILTFEIRGDSNQAAADVSSTVMQGITRVVPSQ